MNLYRPIYHFMPQKNWMNDPNGPVYYKGKYHLFYQHNPTDYHWDTMHWGHATSTDLVHWQHLPIALYPSKELGETHCFSGCAVINDENLPVIFYTSIGENERNARDGAQQWMAISRDGMATFEKVPSNPVMTGENNGELDIKEWRDPFVWKENGHWFMVLGGEHEGIGCVLIYGSDNLTEWKLLNIMLEDSSYRLIECPNMLKFGDKYVLVYSPSAEVVYRVGTLDENYQFITEYVGKVDNSGWEGFYAPNTLFTSPDGRKIMWGWMTESSRGDFKGAEGWAGAQSIPRVLTLENNRLKMEPLEEYKSLRYDELYFSGRVSKDKKIDITNAGRALEIFLKVSIEGNNTFAINVLEAPDGSEKTVINFNTTTKEITLDRELSSLSPDTHKGKLYGKINDVSSNELEVRIFVDHSIVEVFVNSSICISTRVYPMKEESLGASIEVIEGEPLYIEKLNSWRMNSIW